MDNDLTLYNTINRYTLSAPDSAKMGQQEPYYE